MIVNGGQKLFQLVPVYGKTFTQVLQGMIFIPQLGINKAQQDVRILWYIHK
jgi:hypothetical protein